MFRRGGIANEGIMSGLQDQSGYVDESRLGLNSLVRPGYAEGDIVEGERVGFADGNTWFQTPEIKRLDSGEIDYDYYEKEDLEIPTSWGERNLPHSISGYDFMGIPAAIAKLPYKLFGGEEGDVAQLYGKEEKEKLEFERERKEQKRKEKREIGIFGGAPKKDREVLEETEAGDSIMDTTKEVTLGDNTRASDVKAIYEDILPLLQSTMGVDDSELNRQKYLELAKFGANLMAQPGGSLTRAIGKAGEQPLEGLTRIGEIKRKGKRAPAEIAMKIALRETEGGQLMKNARDLMKADKSLTLKEAMDKVTDKGTDTSEARIQKDSVILGDMLKSGWAGAKAARAIDAAGFDSTYFKMWPKNEKDAVDGQLYIKKDGTLWLIKGKDALEWKPQKQKFE